MSTIPQTVARLAVVLRSEEDLYVRMRDLLRREEAELIGLDPDRLAETIESKRALAEEGRLLEESRALIASELAGALGAGNGPVRLSQLITLLGDEAGELPSLHARLSGLIGVTRSLLASNEGFANRSLARVQDTLRSLGQAVPEEIGYGPGTRHASATGRGRLVRQAI